MSKDISLSNVPDVSVGKAIKLLRSMYSGSIMSGVSLSTLPSVMLWGPPGIGKSQGVRQLAELIKKDTGKDTHVTDVRLLLFNPIDLRGIPTSNADKTLAIWLKPQIFNMDDSDNVVNILFLDEISAAPQSVQAAAYQITLDKTVGEHKLPENCIVIAAGNRTTDKSVAYKMPKALANRLLHLEINDNFDSWKRWAVGSNINPMVTGFLSFRPDHLMQFDASSEDLAFATPRSWEMVSNLLNSVNNDVEEISELISGLVGTGTAIEFISWVKIYDKLPSIEDIFDGKMPDVPKAPDVSYALVSSMTTYAKQHKDDMRKIENSVEYAVNMSPDFTTVLFKDYMYFDDDYRNVLMSFPAFSRWVSKHGKLLNGVV